MFGSLFNKSKHKVVPVVVPFTKKEISIPKSRF
jgi:hypothetical protein